MKFHYVCKDVILTPAMKEAAEEKLGRLEHYFRSAAEVDVMVTISVRSDRDQAVEAAFVANGFNLRAKASSEDYYDALDLLVDKLEGQLRKVKTQILKTKKHNSLASDILLEQIQSDANEADLEIVKRKTLSLAPMDVDEALTRMDALGHSFFIFLNSSTGLVNVLYEREDHGYGVIEIEK